MKAALAGSKASEPASQISFAFRPMAVICRWPALSNSWYSVGESLPMKKSLLGTAIAAKVKYRFSSVSTMKLALSVPPGVSRPPTEPMVAPGSAAAKAGNQAEPLPPSATEMMGAVATWPMLKASKLPLLKPRRSGAKLMLLVGARFCTVTLTSTLAACAVRLRLRPRVSAAAAAMPATVKRRWDMGSPGGGGSGGGGWQTEPDGSNSWVRC